MPVGWQLGSSPASVNVASIVSGPACFLGTRCANVQSRGSESKGLSYLVQTIDATPYRGKRLTYRAAVRAEVTGGSAVRMQVHIHHPDGTTSIRDAMGLHPIRSTAWTYYEINAPVALDARDIMFGVQVVGEGAAWIDNISLKAEDVVYNSADEAVRALVTQFADARNAHDGTAAAATYAEDGEYFNTLSTPVVNGVIKGKEALAGLWSGVSGHVERRILGTEFLSPNIAAVHVIAEDANQLNAASQLFEETFIVLKDTSGWRIKVHQATRVIAPPISAR